MKLPLWAGSLWGSCPKFHWFSEFRAISRLSSDQFRVEAGLVWINWMLMLHCFKFDCVLFGAVSNVLASGFKTLQITVNMFEARLKLWCRQSWLIPLQMVFPKSIYPPVGLLQKGLPQKSIKIHCWIIISVIKLPLWWYSRLQTHPNWM